MGVEQQVVQQLGFGIGGILAADSDKAVQRLDVEAGRLRLALEVLKVAFQSIDLVQQIFHTVGELLQLFGRRGTRVDQG